MAGFSRVKSLPLAIHYAHIEWGCAFRDYKIMYPLVKKKKKKSNERRLEQMWLKHWELKSSGSIFHKHEWSVISMI